MTGHDYASWAGRLSYHLEALLDPSGPDWLRLQRRENARKALEGYEAELSAPHPRATGYDDETRNLPGLAS